MTVYIERDDLTDGGVAALLNSHLSEMRKYSPAESIHAIDPKKLRDPSMTFWSARSDGKVVGCGAVKEYAPDAGEVKSMKTDTAFLRQGIAATLLETIIREARSRGYQTLKLETGTHDAFLPAIAMYKRFGFVDTGPFSSYQEDPYSCFFSLSLR